LLVVYVYISLKSIDGTLREADAAMRVAAYDSAAKLLADVQQRQPRNRDIALRLATARRATGA
jgi:thioredoxin-like negative regulator of GroEL